MDEPLNAETQISKPFGYRNRVVLSTKVHGFESCSNEEPSVLDDSIGPGLKA